MKKLLLLLSMTAFFSILLNQAYSQSFLDKLKQKAKDKANQKVDSKTDKAMDNTLDKADDATKGAATKKDGDATTPPATNSANASNAKEDAAVTPPSVAAYQNYDFRAGDKIIFGDNFAADPDGEFASHWDLVAGQAVVNKVTGYSSFLLTDGNYARVKPLMKTDTYLTSNFSVEYDVYLTEGAYGLILFINNKAEDNLSVHINSGGIDYSHPGNQDLSGSFPDAIRYAKFFDKWHHIAMAFKNDQLKVYVDQYRILTVPHCNFKDPANLQCAGIGSIENPIVFKDFKVADGATMNMIDAIMTNGKFVTHGINFDVNKSTLKPESMGVIGDMVKYLQAHADLKLEIDGHTDSDGSDAANLTLSAQRADAVKAAIVQGGIDASRLTTKGLGAGKPLSKNDSPEGKANNRRVEFVKV